MPTSVRGASRWHRGSDRALRVGKGFSDILGNRLQYALCAIDLEIDGRSHDEAREIGPHVRPLRFIVLVEDFSGVGQPGVADVGDDEPDFGMIDGHLVDKQGMCKLHLGQVRERIARVEDERKAL